MSERKLSKTIESMIRVDQAGEYGATRIYAGQLAVLGASPIGDTLRHMLSQEEAHLKTFNDMCVERGVQPTLMQPLWYVGGFAMGAVTALMGEKSAHACTIAVEEVIADHYQDQLARLDESEADLKAIVHQFREEEIEHKDHAEQEGGRDAPLYEGITRVVKGVTRAAIWVSEKI